MKYYKVHPRLRGVLLCEARSPETQKGSSPLTRGSVQPALSPYPLVWFIPAYAGFCARSVHGAGKDQVHPRLRGVLTHESASGMTRWGSSPLTRGSVEAFRESAKTQRFIPAYAGL